MKIVLTSLLSPWDDRHGGGQVATHNLSRALADRGHRVRVVYTGKPDPSPSGKLKYEAVFLPHSERIYLTASRVARELRRHREWADVVHSHGVEGAFLKTAVGNRAGLVATSHHPDPIDLTTPPSPASPFARLGWTRTNILPLLERRALRRADLVVCVSRFSHRTLAARGYLPRGARVAVVHNGALVSDRVADPEANPASTPRDGVDLLCIARLDHHKGIRFLLEAVAGLDPPMTLDLVGTGPLEGDLRAMVEELGLSDRVRFHGYLDPDRVQEIQARARVLVLPSLSENFPLVILDGLHHGNVIVSSDVGGISEAVEDGVDGLLVEPGDPDAMRAAIARVITEPGLAARLGESARARAPEFTWEASARAAEAAYGMVQS